MKRILLLLSAFILLVAGKCDEKRKEKYLKPYIQFSDNEDAFEQPNLIYFPGDVVSRNKKTGKMIKLATLKDVDIQESPTIGVTFKNNVNSNLGLNLSFLGIKDLSFLGDIDNQKLIKFNYKEEETSSLTFKNGILGFNEALSKINKDITTASQNINLDLENNDIILLVEIKRAKKMSFGFDKKMISENSFDVKIEKEIASAKADIKWDKNSDYQVDYSKDTPYHVRYNKVFLKITGGIGGMEFTIDKNRS
ncbi:hypothetical protein [Flavivirga eckloniae]|nr:hypothetical protein [Flavivirga eckloniae]